MRERRRESDGRTYYFSPNTEKVERNVSAAIFIFDAAVVVVVDVVVDVVVVDVNGRAGWDRDFNLSTFTEKLFESN